MITQIVYKKRILILTVLFDYSKIWQNVRIGWQTKKIKKRMGGEFTPYKMILEVNEIEDFMWNYHS